MKFLRHYLPLYSVVLAATLVLGCQLAAPLVHKPNVQISFGSMTIAPDSSLAVVMGFNSATKFGVQDLQTNGTQRVEVTVSGPNFPNPVTAIITRDQFNQDKAVANFKDIPPGPVTVKANAFDAFGNILSMASGNANIVTGQTAILTLTCVLNTGKLQVIYDCPDCPNPSVDYPTPTPDPSPTPISTPVPTPAPTATPKPLPLVSDDFTVSNGGWTVIQGGSAPTLSTTGGNPGGYLKSSDVVGGAEWYWKAPLKYLGDKSACYGLYLNFRQYVSTLSQPINKNNDIILTSGTKKYYYDITSNPKQTWTSYSIPLSETGWLSVSTGKPATHEEFIALLGNLTDFVIRGEYSGSAGDKGYIAGIEFGGVKLMP